MLNDECQSTVIFICTTIHNQIAIEYLAASVAHTHDSVLLVTQISQGPSQFIGKVYDYDTVISTLCWRMDATEYPV